MQIAKKEFKSKISKKFKSPLPSRNEVLIMSVLLPKFIYKFMKFNNYWEDIFKSQRLYMPYPRELNDPFEGQLIPIDTASAGDSILLAAGKLNKNARPLLDQYRIVSFASNIRNKSMWAYYADDYKGFAIEFNTYNTFSTLEPVIYKPNHLNIPSQHPKKSTEIKENIKTALLYKSKDWENEDEFRLISDQPTKQYINFQLNDIESIILGCSISANNKEKIITYAKEMNLKIKNVYTVPREDKLEFYYEGNKPPLNGCSYKDFIINDM